MPPQQPMPTSGIKWHEVTWYSKLGALILFVGIVPGLSFYIGTQYATVYAPIATSQQPVENKQLQPNSDLYTSTNDIEGWKTYDSPTAPGGFEFQYPSTWLLDEQMANDYSITLSSNDNANKNLQSKIYIQERVSYDCVKYGKPVTIDGRKGYIAGWNDHGSPNFFMTREACLLDYSGTGLTFLMTAYSPDAQQVEDKVLSTFHILKPGPPAEE